MRQEKQRHLSSEDRPSRNSDHLNPFSPSRTYSVEYERNSLRTLDLALSEASAYRLWRALDPGKGCTVDERYAAMPTLTKKDIIEHFPQGFVPNGLDVNRGLADGEIVFVKTSGSTGEAVTNIWHQKWWDASERASWRLNSVASEVATGNHCEAILANPLNVGYASDEVDLPMEKRRLSRFLYLNERTNPLAWTNEYMDRMMEELEVFKPAVLEANPSLLAKLSRYTSASGKSIFQPRLIVFTYEYPTRFHYQQIHRSFDAPTASSYGTTEVGTVFMECEKGKLHQNTEFCRVDFQPLKPDHGGPVLGRILVTTFNNPWYLLVRFDVGDLVRLDEEGTCPCGREDGMLLSAIEGRTKNVTLTCDGRLVTLRELDNAISTLEDVEQYQLDQPSGHEYRLQLVTQRWDRDMLSKEACGILRNLYGENAKVSVVFAEAIAPSVSGKYSISQTSLPVKIEDYLDERWCPKDNTNSDNTKRREKGRR